MPNARVADVLEEVLFESNLAALHAAISAANAGEPPPPAHPILVAVRDSRLHQEREGAR